MVGVKPEGDEGAQSHSAQARKRHMASRRSFVAFGLAVGALAAAAPFAAADPDGSAPPAPEGPGAPESVEQQLAAQVAAQDPEFARYIYWGPTPAAAQAPPPPAGGGYVPRLYGQQAIETVVRRGLSQIGRIYSWGGGGAYGPSRGVRDGGVGDSYGDYNISGYDCSGLMVFSFAGAGVLLPKFSGHQYMSGRHVPAAQMRRGDMIFYGPNGTQHVALYLGNGWMLESPESGERVHVTRVRTGGMCPDVVRLF